MRIRNIYKSDAFSICKTKKSSGFKVDDIHKGH